MAPKATSDEEKAAKKTDETPVKKKAAGRKAPSKKMDDAAAAGISAGEDVPQMTQSDVIRNYRKVYDRCMEGETKSFDAKGALSALDQISKLLGLDAPIKAADIEGNRVILTLSDQVGERGD